MDLILVDCSSVYPEKTKPHPDWTHKNHPPENTGEQSRKTNYQHPRVLPLSGTTSQNTSLSFTGDGDLFSTEKFASEGVTRVAWDNMQLHKKPCYQRRRWIDCLNRTTYTLIVASSAGFNSTVSSWKECEYKYGDNRDIWHHLANQIKY